jgi:hypothetical protein
MAKAKVEFWGVGLNDQPQKVAYEVPPFPVYWPTARYALVRVEGVAAEELEALVEVAEAFGWKYNPITGTFYRED